MKPAKQNSHTFSTFSGQLASLLESYQQDIRSYLWSMLTSSVYQVDSIYQCTLEAVGALCPGPEGTLCKKHNFITEENLHTPGYTCRNRQEKSETLAKAGPRNTCTYIHYHIYIYAQTHIICTYHTITTGTHEYDCAVLCITKIGCKHLQKVHTT